MLTPYNTTIYNQTSFNFTAMQQAEQLAAPWPVLHDSVYSAGDLTTMLSNVFGNQFIIAGIALNAFYAYNLALGRVNLEETNPLEEKLGVKPIRNALTIGLMHTATIAAMCFTGQLTRYFILKSGFAPYIYVSINGTKYDLSIRKIFNTCSTVISTLSGIAISHGLLSNMLWINFGAHSIDFRNEHALYVISRRMFGNLAYVLAEVYSANIIARYALTSVPIIVRFVGSFFGYA